MFHVVGFRNRYIIKPPLGYDDPLARRMPPLEYVPIIDTVMLPPLKYPFQNITPGPPPDPIEVSSSTGWSLLRLPSAQYKLALDGP
jgi:hypothetical protein